MIKLASPGIEGSPNSVASQIRGREKLKSSQRLLGVSTVPSKYQFIGSPICDLAAKSSQRDIKENPACVSKSSTPMWKIALDGFCFLAFLTAIFCVSAYMLVHLTFEFSTLGDAQVWEYLRRGF